jgi:hypothetical protein
LAVFLIAAHIAFARFEPMLSSKQLADTIIRKARPPTPSSSSATSPTPPRSSFTRTLLPGKPALLVLPRCGQHGEGSPLLWGSCYPDAPNIFLSEDQLSKVWGTGERKWLFAQDINQQSRADLLAGRLYPVQSIADKALWTDRPLAQLEAMGMSVEMTSGVLVADMLEGMQFALGPSMVMRQSTVEKIGGFERSRSITPTILCWATGPQPRAGETVALSSYIVEHHVLNAAFKKSIAHQQGWATSTRFSRPMGHVGEVLTYAVPFGLLGLAVLGAAGHLALGLGLLAFTILDRVLLCLLVAGCVVNDRAALRKAWLYPLRDFMGFCFWVRSYFGSRSLRYRGDPYELLPQGRLRMSELGAITLIHPQSPQ